jgi:hypothetical protein
MRRTAGRASSRGMDESSLLLLVLLLVLMLVLVLVLMLLPS